MARGRPKKSPGRTPVRAVTESMVTVQTKPVTPPSEFTLLGVEHLDMPDCEELTYVRDLRGNGVLLRTVWMREKDVIGMSIIHIQNMGIREGKLVRSIR